jgi:hypothetical protein
VINATEEAAEALALRFEMGEGRVPHRVSHGWSPVLMELVDAFVKARGLAPARRSCDFVSLGASNEVQRLVEVKGKRTSQGSSVPLLDRQMETSEAFGDDYWLYVGFDVLTTAGYLIAVASPHKLPWHLLAPNQPRSTTGRVQDERRWFVDPAEVIRRGARVLG